MKQLFVVCILIGYSCFSNHTETNKSSQDKNTIKPNILAKVQDTIRTYTYSKEELLGKIDETIHNSFQKVPSELTNRTFYLRSEVIDSLIKMVYTAKQDGVQLKVLSGTRNFNRQKQIWQSKWKGKYGYITNKEKRAKSILKWSSMPGTSRHHWGTDIDFNALTNSYFNTGKGKKEYDWLIKHAPEFGFCQVYTSKENGRTGYNEEKWHWSFLPISSIMLAEYNELINNTDISDFYGSEFAEIIDMKTNYVNGISNNCK